MISDFFSFSRYLSLKNVLIQIWDWYTFWRKRKRFEALWKTCHTSSYLGRSKDNILILCKIVLSFDFRKKRFLLKKKWVVEVEMCSCNRNKFLLFFFYQNRSQERKNAWFSLSFLECRTIGTRRSNMHWPVYNFYN